MRVTQDSQKPLVVCAGILVSDLFVPPLIDIPRPGQLVAIDPPLYQSGGCAANTGVDLAKLGVSVRVSGRVGDDALGQQVVDQLASVGVDTSGISRSASSPTSQTVVLSIEGDDRRFLHCVGANAEYTADEVAAGAEGASILVVGGFLVLPGLEPGALIPVLDRSRASGAQVLLDVVIPVGQTGVAEQVRPLLPHVDGFLPNRDEAEALTGRVEASDQAAVLLEWGCPWVVITGGGEGALYADAKRTITVEPLEVEFIDGSGSGDAFTAGIVVGMLRSWPIEDTLRYAAVLGASVCRGLGCHSTLATDDEARARMGQVELRIAPPKARG